MKRIMILFAAVFSLIWGGCSDPFENQAFRETDKMPAASYMEANSSTYSLWVDLLNYTGLFNTVNLKMDYTCFVPDNERFSTKERNFIGSGIEQGRGCKFGALSYYRISSVYLFRLL